MVKWYVKDETPERVVYEYYPEDDKHRQPGIITIDRIKDMIELTTAAESDSRHTVDKESARLICEVLFDTSPKIEAEVAQVAGTSYWVYYDHARRKIIDDYNAGIIKDGMSIWY